MTVTVKMATTMGCVNPVVIWGPNEQPWYNRINCEGPNCMGWRWSQSPEWIEDMKKKNPKFVGEPWGYCGLAGDV